MLVSVGEARAQDTAEPPFRLKLSYRSPGAFTLEKGARELAREQGAGMSDAFTASRSAWAWYQRSIDPELSPARAIEYCRTALLIDRQFALAYNQLAVLQYEAGLVAEAKRTWRIAVRTDPTLFSARANVALMYYLERKAGPARKHLQVALSTEADYAPVQNTLGLIQELEGNLGAASAAYRIAVEQDDGYQPAWKNLARLYPEGDVSAADALAALNQAIRLETNPGEQAALQQMAADLAGANAPADSLGLAGTPGIPPTGLLDATRPRPRRAVRVSSSSRRGRAGARAGRPARVAAQTIARSTLSEQSALQLSGTPTAAFDGPAPEIMSSVRQPEVFEWYNRALASPSGSQERVSALYTALEIDPSFAGGYVALGEALVELEDHSAALDAFETALELAADRVDAMEGRARQLRAVGRKEDALIAGRRWTDAAPRDPQAWRFVGERLVEFGDHPRAESALRSALALAPEDPNVHFALGLLAYQQEAFSDAIDAYRRAVNADPTFAKGYHNMGITFRRMNRPDDALFAYRRAIDLAPDWDVAYNSIGNLHRTMGHCTEALAAFNRAVALNANNPHAYTNMGLCYESLGDDDAAIASFTRAVEIAPAASWTRIARERLDVLTRSEGTAEE